MASRAERYQLYTLAGSTEDRAFPPTLNTTKHPAELSPAETPDSIGLNMEKDGRIATGTIPSGTSRVQKTVTIGGIVYAWHYRRLWGISGNTLIAAAPNYDAAFFEQGPNMPFNEDANAILALVPFGSDLMCVSKASGSYVVSNAGDQRGVKAFRRSPLIQELQLPAANQIIELDGVIYISNANGLFGLNENGEVAELTRAVRDNVIPFANQALTCDYEKKRIICGTTGVYEVSTGKLFKYSGSTFSFTSRQFELPDRSPMSNDRLLFVIQHANTSGGSLQYRAKTEDDNYTSIRTLQLPYRQELFTVVECPLPDQVVKSTLRFQIQVTALSSNKYIRAIVLDSDAFNLDDYKR